MLNGIDDIELRMTCDDIGNATQGLENTISTPKVTTPTPLWKHVKKIKFKRLSVLDFRAERLTNESVI